MKTIKKIINSRLLTSTYQRSFSLVSLALLLLVSLTGFISEKDSPINVTLMPGVVFEIEVTDHEQSPPITEIIEAAVEGRNLKMQIPPRRNGEGKGEMIFRGGRGKYGEVVLVDDEKKEYYVMDDTFVDSMMERVNQSKSMMDEALKSLSKEQREMIEKMQKEKGAKIPGFDMGAVPQIKMVNTGIKAAKAGYPCVKYEVYLDGVKIRENWTTDWSNIDGGEEAEGAFEGMNDFFERIKDKMGEMPGNDGFYDDMNFNNGFPVLTKNYDEETGDLEDESILRSSRRQTIDPDEFEPPSGYKRQEMFGN